MRGTLQFLLGLLLSSSLALAALPRQPLVPEPDKADCCARMKAQSTSHECDRHAPKPVSDTECCALCAMGCAVLPTFAMPLVYPPVGDETFAAYISAEQSRSQRPPVPPPRA